MKRLHVHVGVGDLETSIRFYATLFGAEPSVRKPDYAKWMLDDPRVNFAISSKGRPPGLDHLGIQTEDEGELRTVTGRLDAATLSVYDRGRTVCCHAESDKAWVRDPSGIAWETFLTHRQVEDPAETKRASGGGSARTPCCN